MDYLSRYLALIENSTKFQRNSSKILPEIHQNSVELFWEYQEIFNKYRCRHVFCICTFVQTNFHQWFLSRVKNDTLTSSKINFLSKTDSNKYPHSIIFSNSKQFSRRFSPHGTPEMLLKLRRICKNNSKNFGDFNDAPSSAGIYSCIW